MKRDSIHIKPNFSHSKDEIWNSHFKKSVYNLDVPGRKMVNSQMLFKWFAGVAAIFIFILLPIVANQKRTIISSTGENITLFLPDDSKVVLNAQSSLSYKPYLWFISRKVELNGEAYFEVSKGKTFSVFSKTGHVEVLGTSFNILDRSNYYKVNCYTGRVQVQDKQNNTAILSPNMQVLIQNNKFKITHDLSENSGKFWFYNQFIFVNVPLSFVLSELERQYSIVIQTTDSLNFRYTMKFSKDMRPEDILQIIEDTFNIHLNYEFVQ